MALLAFDPQFLFVSGYFSNDPVAIAVSAATLWVVVDAIARGGALRRHYVAGAALAALGLLAKTSLAPGLAVAGATIVAADRRELRSRLLDSALAAGIVLIVAGPHLVWAMLQRSGPLDALYAGAAGPLIVPPEERLRYLLGNYWRVTFESYWCRFDWMNVRAPAFVYVPLMVFSATALLACAVAVIRGPSADRLASRGLLAYLAASFAATGLAHVVFNASIASPQGRHLFVSAPQMALLLAVGVDRMARGERRMRMAVLVITTALFVLDVYCLRHVLWAAYGPPPSLGGG